MNDPLRLSFNPPAAANDNGRERVALKVEDFILDCVVLPQPFQDQLRLKKIFDILRKGKYGAALVDELVVHKGTTVEFNEAVEFAYYSFGVRGRSLIKDGFILKINPLHPNSDLAAFLSHELRHLQQGHSDTIFVPRNLSPYDFAHYNRFVEADAQTAAIITCFDLMVRHRDHYPFTAFIHTEYRPMCEVIQDEYNKDPKCLDTLELRRKVFDVWFQDRQPRATYDEKSLESSMLDYFSSLPRSRLTPHDLVRVGVSGSERENYLTLPGFRALDDPYYSQVVDPAMEKLYAARHQRWMKCPAPLALPFKNK